MGSQKPKKEIHIYPNLHAVQLRCYTSQATTTKKKERALGSVGTTPHPRIMAMGPSVFLKKNILLAFFSSKMKNSKN